MWVNAIKFVNILPDVEYSIVESIDPRKPHISTFLTSGAIRGNVSFLVFWGCNMPYVAYMVMEFLPDISYGCDIPIALDQLRGTPSVTEKTESTTD